MENTGSKEEPQKVESTPLHHEPVKKKSVKLFVGVAMLLAVIILLGGFVFVRGMSRSSMKTSENLDTQPPQSNFEMNGGSEDQKNFWQGREDAGQNCSQTPAVFSRPITDIANISKITPGSSTGDSRYTYLWKKDSQPIPLFAPADGTLIKITYKVRADLPTSMSRPDYDLVFQADCQTTYAINHVTDPRSDIAAVNPITEPIQLKPGSGVNDADTKPTKSISVKAGDEIGITTGTPAALNFDFGIFVDNQAVCPYEKFSDSFKPSWLALFRGASCTVSGGL